MGRLQRGWVSVWRTQPTPQSRSQCGRWSRTRAPPRCDRSPFWRWGAAEVDRSSWSGVGDGGGGAGPWKNPGTSPLSGPHGWASPRPRPPRGSWLRGGCWWLRRQRRTEGFGAGWGRWRWGESVHGRGPCSPGACGPAAGFSRWTAWSSPSSDSAGSPRPAGAGAEREGGEERRRKVGKGNKRRKEGVVGKGEGRRKETRGERRR